MNFLHDLQEAVAARLEGVDGVGETTPPIRVIVESKGDVGNLIETQTKALGVALLVGTPGYRRRGESLENGVEVALVVAIREHAVINRGPTGTKLDYLTVALRVVASLDGWNPGAGWQPIRFEAGETIEAGPGVEFNLHEVSFSTVVRVGKVTV